MKFQNKIVKRLVSILLCGSICVVAAVAVSYSPWTSTVTGMSNIKSGITATTGGASGKGTYTAHGTTWYKGSDGEMKTLELESVDYYMAVRANGGVDLSTEEKQIHTNAAGETYGEALVVKYLNEDVDMISAIGKNGTEGYIKVSDLPQNIPDYVPHDHEIPVYASDGVTVIDSFFISSGYTDTVG